MSDWITLGPLSDLEQNAGKRFDVGEHRIAVFLIGDDVYAIGDRCSHAEASLSDGELFDTEVECPRHGSAFDVRPVYQPPSQPPRLFRSTKPDASMVRLRSESRKKHDNRFASR